MKITGIKTDGWPRLSTLSAITKEQYRALQGGGTEDVEESQAKKLIALGVCVGVAEEGGAE
jgi:hypothetical protein